MRRGTDRLVLSCEHASRAIPRRYSKLFVGADVSLGTHAGSDLGSQEMSRHLANELGVEVTYARASRLLVDCNRSLHHRSLFSVYTRNLPEAERGEILANYYHPHRDAVTSRINKTIATQGQAVHVSVHSFTGVINGKARETDIGLLYDPARADERLFCAEWQAQLRAEGTFRVRRNYPYKGVSDGLVTHLRRQQPAHAYLAIELEFRQELMDGPRWTTLRQALAETLESTLATLVKR